MYKHVSTVTVALKNDTNASAIRTTLLDPSLCTKNNNQKDLFSDKYNSTAYRTHKKSTLGEWDAYTIEIDPGKFQNLFVSDKFYIPNVTVQDLH